MAKGRGYVEGSADLLTRLIADGATNIEHAKTRLAVLDDIRNGTTTAAAFSRDNDLDFDRVIRVARTMVGRTYEGFADVDDMPPYYWDGIVSTATVLCAAPGDDRELLYRQAEHDIHAKALSWGR